MPPPRNEIEDQDQRNRAAEAPMGFAVMLIAGLHVLCCGLPLLLLSGVTLATISPSSPMLGAILGLIGVVAFFRYRTGSVVRAAEPPRRPS